MRTLLSIVLLLISFHIYSQNKGADTSDFEVVVREQAPLIHLKGEDPDSSKSYAKDIELTIVNLTGIDVDSLVVGETFIGELAKNETKHIKVEGIIKMASTGEPYFLNAVLRDSTGIDPSPTVQCSTNFYYLQNGTYTFYLVKVDWGKGEKVFWSSRRE